MGEEMQKVYCMERPDNTAMLAELINAKSQGVDAATMTALFSKNNGNEWNNPFMYLIWLALLGGGNGNGLFGGGNNNEINDRLNAIQAQMNTNQNSNLALQAINGNHEALHDLSAAMGVNTATLQGAINNVQNAITMVGGQVGMTGERVINSVLLGNKDLTQALQSCCCENKVLCLQNQAQTIARIDQLANGVQQGFASVGYAAQANTNSIIQAGNANTQRIIDTLNNHWTTELSQELQNAKFEQSQLKQNVYLGGLISGGSTGGGSIW